MKYSNSRTTFGGKGDTFRSDFMKYQEGSLWQHEWSSDIPEKEGQYMVKYYNENNKLIFDTVYYTTHDNDGMPISSIGGEYPFHFCKNKVGLKFKYKGDT